MTRIRLETPSADLLAARLRTLRPSRRSRQQITHFGVARAAMWSPEVNAVLDAASSRCVVDGAYAHPAGPDLVDAVVDVLRGPATSLYDAPKVRLASDLSADDLLAGTDVLTQATTYFATTASNDITGVVVRDEDSGAVLYDGWSWFVEHAGEVAALGSTRCSDHIGAQTIALLADGTLVLARQSVSSAQSAGLWAPSGSGSLDADDVPAAVLLRSAAIAGMERELAEECGLDPATFETELTGFARMLHRGGKPEFFGLTRVEAGADQLRIGEDERPWVAELHPLRMRATDPVTAADELEHYAATLAEQSILLHLALRFAADHLRRGVRT